jgi:hypothetical protein
VLILRQWKAPANRDVVDRLGDIAAAVAPDFQPVLKPARDIQAAALQIPPETFPGRGPDPTDRYRAGEPILEGEVYANGSELMVVRAEAEGPRFRVNRGAIIAETPQEVTVRCFGISGSANSEALDQFVESAATALAIPFEVTRYESARFNELASEPGRAPTTVPRSELEAARTLINREVRTLALAIKAAGGLLVGDLAKQVAGLSSAEIDVLRDQLELAALIGSETVVVCKKTQVQIARAPSHAEVAAMAASGVRCGCGRKIDDERVEAALTVTDLGREMLDSSRWFSVVLHEELVRVGVDPSRILLEQQQGGDEMDVLAEISGELVFFELKDKEFSLGNAYSFGAKIGIVRPEHSVIVASERVGNDAKDHFQRAGLSVPQAGRNSITGDMDERPPQVQYIEGLDELSGRLSEIASSIYAGDASRELAKVLPRASLDANALTDALLGSSQSVGGSAKSSIPRTRRASKRSS